MLSSISSFLPIGKAARAEQPRPGSPGRSRAWFRASVAGSSESGRSVAETDVIRTQDRRLCSITSNVAKNGRGGNVGELIGDCPLRPARLYWGSRPPLWQFGTGKASGTRAFPHLAIRRDEDRMKMTLIMPGVGRKAGRSTPPPGSWSRWDRLSWRLSPRPDVEIAFVNDRLEPIPYDQPTDAVGINVETYTARRAYAIAAQYRAAGSAGDPRRLSSDARARRALLHADAIVEGEAETVWPRVIEDLRAGRFRAAIGPTADRAPRTSSPPADLCRQEIPADDAHRDRRGCRFACKFCSVSQFFRQTAFERPLTMFSRRSRRRAGGRCSSWTTTSSPTWTGPAALRGHPAGRHPLGQPGQHQHGQRPGAPGTDAEKRLLRGADRV